MPLSGFNAEEWQRLTPAERVKQCRRMAEEARALSKTNNNGELKRSYLEISVNWDHLADEMETISSSRPPP